VLLALTEGGLRSTGFPSYFVIELQHAGMLSIAHHYRRWAAL
jgi:hypothetical protein